MTSQLPLVANFSDRFEFFISTDKILVDCFLTFQVIHLYITFGLIAGTGRGMAFCSSMSILSRHFSKYSKVAYGISTAGVGFSALVWPPLLMAFEALYGWRGAILMMAGLYGQTVVTSSLFRPVESECLGESNNETNANSLESKVRQDHREKVTECQNAADDTMEDQQNVMEQPDGPFSKDKGNILFETLSLFKKMVFACFCLHYALIFFPLMIVYTHFGSYVLSLGMSKYNVAHLYMTMGITIAIARISSGTIVGLLKLNSLTVVMVCTILNGIVTLALPFANNLIFFFVYAVLVCILSAPTYVLCVPIIMESVPSEQVSTAFGVTSFFNIPASLLGAPIAGKGKI